MLNCLGRLIRRRAAGISLPFLYRFILGEAYQLFDQRTLHPASVYFSSDTSLSNSLLISDEDGHTDRLFDDIPYRDMAYWTALISDYHGGSRWEDMWILFCRLHLWGFRPDPFTYSRLVIACSSLRSRQRGEQLLVHITRSGCLSNLYVVTGLVDFFAKRGSLVDAFRVFDEVPCRNVVLWNAIIAGSVRHKENRLAVSLFYAMLNDSSFCMPNSFTFSSVLAACTGLEDLELGRGIHGLAIKFVLGDAVFVATALIDMYMKCGKIEEALLEFHTMREPNVVSWTTIISGHVQRGDAASAFEFFRRMRVSGVDANLYTVTSILSACVKSGKLQQAVSQLHCWILNSGFLPGSVVSEALINAYAKCGDVELAEMVFLEAKDCGEKNFVSTWSAMIAGLAQLQNSYRSVSLFKEMLQQGMQPDKYSTSSVLSAIDCEELGKQLHCFALKADISDDVSVASSIFTMYSKCGTSLDEASRLFERMIERDAVCWTSMIAGCAQHGHCEKAFEFLRMMLSEGMHLDSVTLSAVLTASASCKSSRKGKEIHCFVLRSCLGKETIVGSSLVNMYSKCGDTISSLKVFTELPQKDQISWSSLITGLAQNGHGEEALLQFKRMRQTGLKLDAFVLSSLLGLLSSLAQLELGKQFHAQTVKTGLEFKLSVSSSLVTLYSKSGDVVSSRRAFDLIPSPDVISWTAIIVGYAHNGQGVEALEMYNQMIRRAIIPDPVTFVGVLSACSHSGLVEEAFDYLQSMVTDYGLQPGIPHYACMVDVLGRAGKLAEAIQFIDTLPLKPDAIVWGALLSACRLHGDVEIGRLAAKKVLELEPMNSGTYISLSNMCAERGQWEYVTKIRTMMGGVGLKKDLAWSSA